MSDARERWKETHRKRRIRARWLNPLQLWTSNVLLAIAFVCLVLAAVVDLNWCAGFLVAMFGGLRVRGITLGEIFSSGGGGGDASVGAGSSDGGGGEGSS